LGQRLAGGGVLGSLRQGGVQEVAWRLFPMAVRAPRKQVGLGPARTEVGGFVPCRPGWRERTGPRPPGLRGLAARPRDRGNEAGYHFRAEATNRPERGCRQTPGRRTCGVHQIQLWADAATLRKSAEEKPRERRASVEQRSIAPVAAPTTATLRRTRPRPHDPGRCQESHVITCARRQDIAEQTVFAGQSRSIDTSCDDPLPCALQRAAGDGGNESSGLGSLHYLNARIFAKSW
jgi:hypothetical protein